MVSLVSPNYQVPIMVLVTLNQIWIFIFDASLSNAVTVLLSVLEG